MQSIRPLHSSPTEGQPGTLLAAGDYSSQAFRHSDDHTTQTDGSKLSAHAHVLKRHRPVRFGLPCASCKAYYASDLPACPICKCAERVPAEQAEAESANISPIPPYRPPMQIALHCDGDGKRFRLESRLLFCAHTKEINAGATSLCSLDENHKTQPESASICLTCYDQVREKLAQTEAALSMDLREAAQIIYEAVWADPSPTEPSRTYQSAAQSLLNELCHRAGIVRLPSAV